MKLHRFLHALGLAVATLACSSCGLIVEGAVISRMKSKAVPAGTTIQSASFSVKVPSSHELYVHHFDKKREILVLYDTDPVTRAYNYFVFPVDAAPGESTGTALLRYYRGKQPGGHWEAMAARAGSVKGSVGQADIRSRREDGGFILSAEGFRDGNRIWMVSHLMFYPNDLNGDLAGTERSAKARAEMGRKDAAAFARSFRLNR